jgi:hypothetical protein
VEKVYLSTFANFACAASDGKQKQGEYIIACVGQGLTVDVFSCLRNLIFQERELVHAKRMNYRLYSQ